MLMFADTSRTAREINPAFSIDLLAFIFLRAIFTIFTSSLIPLILQLIFSSF